MRYQVNNRTDAWNLMRAFEAAKVCAGYPEHNKEMDWYTVEILKKDTQTADRIYCATQIWAKEGTK